jgi:hypothetical protein
MDVVKKLLTNFNHIYPRRSNGNVSLQCTEVELTNILLIGQRSCWFAESKSALSQHYHYLSNSRSFLFWEHTVCRTTPGSVPILPRNQRRNYLGGSEGNGRIGINSGTCSPLIILYYLIIFGITPVLCGPQWVGHGWAEATWFHIKHVPGCL